MATVGSDLLTGILAMRLSMRLFATSPPRMGSKKFRKMPTRKSWMALKVLTLPTGFRNSFQRTPRMEKASRKATPESSARAMPFGVVRFWRKIEMVVGKSTKCATRNKRPMPIRRPMATFAAGVLSSAFQAGWGLVNGVTGMATASAEGIGGRMRPKGSRP